ncbi:aminoacyl-tRNA deacylase [Actinomadura sediminis]|uniref:Aminoacyl-tRNA deacylase n=1 Tax=Actinomadura sediminis TaxID=1038904 RepID=A0ABW3EGS6_9ACTN
MMDALAIHRALLAWETVHEIVRLPIAIGGADELPRALGLPAGRCLATRVLSCDGHRGTGRFLAGAIVPAGDRPPAEAVRRAVGARHARPARPDVINAATEYAADLVCPLLLPDTMRLLIDRRLVDALPPDDVVYTPTGEASTALGIRARSLYELCGAEPADLFGAGLRAEHVRQEVPAGSVRHIGQPGEPNTPGPRHPVG